MSGKPILVKGVVTHDVVKPLGNIPSEVRRRLCTVADVPTRDEILEAEQIPKVIALGLVWDGLKGPFRDNLVKVLAELSNGRTPGNVLDPEDVAGYAMIRLGRVWNGLSLPADETRRAMKDMRDSIFESAGRLSSGATTAQELADLAMGTFEKKLAGNSTATIDTASNPKTTRARIAALQAANVHDRQARATAAGTHDASSAFTQSRSAGKRMSIPEINEANRKYREAMRGRPV